MNKHVWDCHTHVGSYRGFESISPKWREVSLKILINYLDERGVEKAVLLQDRARPARQILEICCMFRDRLIPFCKVDPRNHSWLESLKRYVEEGVKGVGEYTVKLPVDHVLNRRVYEVCGRLEIPILIHLAWHPDNEYGLLDKPGLKGLESVVSEHSNTIFIMHAQGWWREVSAVVNPDVAYPKGPVGEPGRAVEILEDYPNVYGDLSAYSGYNALARDAGFAKWFLERFSNRLLYGSDLLDFFRPERSLLRLLLSLGISDSSLSRILHGNLARLINP